MTDFPTPESLELDTPDIATDRLEALRDLIPEAFSEGKVDFDKLRAALGDVVDGRPERYSFTWAGKRDAIRLLQTPSAATLVPAPEESVNWDTTQHLFIEGDNLEVLKLLYKAYFGRIKLIYIDPPYNTGNDFVYPDDFTDPLGRYLEITGQKDAAGNLVTSNPETSGRYHSAWLSMMYPRLFLARQLLTDDGLIFISIDDHEQANLVALCKEIFGDENYVGMITRSTGTPTGGGFDILVNLVDYILIFSKTSNAGLQGLPFTEEDARIYDQEDERGRYLTRSIRRTGGEDRREDRPSMYYAIKDPDGNDVYPIGPGGYESRWICGPKKYQELVDASLIEWKQIEEAGRLQWKPYQKYYLEGRKKQPSNLWTDVEGNKKGSRDVKALFGGKIFDSPKPVELIERCINIGDDENLIALDFFAGSGTTAHAIVKMNEADGSNRRFILVQLPEPTGQADYPTIADIAKERIRRVHRNLDKERVGKLAIDGHTAARKGFRVFKLAPSTIRAWRGTAAPTPDEYVNQLALLSQPLREGWRAEDVVWEVAIKEGYPLTSRVTTAAAGGQEVYRVEDADGGRAFHVCLDDTVSADVAAALGLASGDLLVVRDAAVDDTTAANLALQCRLKTL